MSKNLRGESDLMRGFLNLSFDDDFFFFLIFSSLLFSFSRQKKNDRASFVEHKERHKESAHVSPPFAHEKRRRTSDCTKKAKE